MNEFSKTRLQVLLYLNSVTLLCVFRVDLFMIPGELEPLIEKRFHHHWSLFRKESFEISFLKNRSRKKLLETSLAEQNFPNEITWIARY